MYLSRLVLNPRSSDVRRDLADCHEMHRTLMSAWPDVEDGCAVRRSLGVLYRVEPPRPGRGPVVLVQSASAPDWSRKVSSNYVTTAETKALPEAYPQASLGRRLRFRLLGNPTRSVATEDRPRGQRVELVREEDKLAWLTRQGHAHGFTIPLEHGVPAVTIGPTEKVQGRRTGEPAVTIGASLFEGVLEVRDAEKFRAAVVGGIGRAKAYGCGLLSIARAG